MVASEVRTKFGQLVHVPSATAPASRWAAWWTSGAESLTVRLEPPSRGEVAVKYADVLPAMEDQKKEVDDNCGLMFLNEGTLLHNCRLRYEKKKIYTYTANILLSINPYEQIPALYSSEAIRDYRGRSLGTRPPHIFAIADKAYREMRRAGESQSIVVSGESGAGKTEGQKAILHYLCENFSDKSKPIERRILERMLWWTTPPTFQRLQRALLDVGLKKEEVADLFRTLGGILHLGNVSFEDSDNSRGGCVIKESSRPALAKAAELLGLSENELRRGLCTRIMQPTKSQGAAGTIIQVQLKADLFEHKGSGLLELLDEEACLPRPSPTHYTEAVHQANRKSKRLIPLRNSKEHRNLARERVLHRPALRGGRLL
ncbi:Myosin and Myosin head domain containing protein [Aphelenchoides fujianensis]|nr:Myosin and Myosin head domain containing protein [Aphelenchoides fujianensis]